MPLTASDMRLASLFADVSAPAYRFQNGYQAVAASDSVQTGMGYWMFFASPHTYSICGLPAAQKDISIPIGWSMIGAFEQSRAAAGITTTPGGALASTIYYFQNGYTAVTTLEPGKGYWVYASQAATVHLSGGASALPVLRQENIFINAPQNFRLPITAESNHGAVQIEVGVSPTGTAGYNPGLDWLAPPQGPAGTFDVRLVQGSLGYLKDFRGYGTGEHTFVLNFTAAQVEDGITLRWNAEMLKKLGRFEITDNVTGSLFMLDMTVTDKIVVLPHSVLTGGLRIKVKLNTPQYYIFAPYTTR
jgi:hypothetical protein